MFGSLPSNFFLSRIIELTICVVCVAFGIYLVAMIHLSARVRAEIRLLFLRPFFTGDLILTVIMMLAVCQHELLSLENIGFR